MNRIEHVAVPTPAQQYQPRLPRPLADVRRRAAQAMFQPAKDPAPARRGTSRLAVALATLAVPLLPGQAFGAAPSAPSSGPGAVAVKPEAPHARHHLHRVYGHGEAYPGSGTMTFEAWSASRWTITLPSREGDAGTGMGTGAGMGMPGYAPPMYPGGYYGPWPAESPRPVVLPDGKRGEIAAYRVSHTSPRAEDSPAVRAARSRVVPDPFTTSRSPANTKQMVVGSPQPANPVTATATATATAADVPTSPCLRTAHPTDIDSRMLVRLRPVTDAMGVVVTHQHTRCTAKVDYLSQARA